MVDVYEWEFPTAVPEKFPKSKYCPDMRGLYYKQGIDFLSKYKGFLGAELLEVEGRFEIPMYDWSFTGIIDLAFIDPKTGELILRDWKSKASFKSKKEEAKYRRQLYLYCAYIKEKYGRFPDKTQFYLMRKDNIVESGFNKAAYDEALEWANNTVKEIRECWVYPPTYSDFFCKEICNFRNTCEYAKG